MLVDSNIIIYAAEPGFDAIRCFVAQNKPVVSVISKVEVLGYHLLQPENKQKLEKLFKILPVLPVSEDIIDKAVTLRQQRKMSLGDSLIAATALIYDLTLVTANVKDFFLIEGLGVLNPLES
jgi:toxin FitB